MWCIRLLIFESRWVLEVSSEDMEEFMDKYIEDLTTEELPDLKWSETDDI